MWQEFVTVGVEVITTVLTKGQGKYLEADTLQHLRRLGSLNLSVLEASILSHFREICERNFLSPVLQLHFISSVFKQCLTVEVW